MATRTASALFQPLSLSPNTPPAGLSTKIPQFLYGCAWKKQHTDSLVYSALQSGFRGIDVAHQPRHYREDLAGEGLRRAIADGIVKRGDLFIQTKFSPPPAQDPHSIPYDPQASIAEQVRQSVAGSLHNLRVSDDPAEAQGTYIDSLVLHSPLRTLADTLEAWRACEALVPDTVRFLGMSNTPLEVLQSVYEQARIKPAVVQNRFVKETAYERDLRKWCATKGIVYQSFWTLTANPQLINSRPVRSLATAATVEPEVALYAFVLGLGNTVILNGTQTHMQGDLEGLERVRKWATEHKYEWENALKHFRDVIGEDMPPETSIKQISLGSPPQP